MKTIKSLAVAAVTATLFFQTTIVRSDDHAQKDHDNNGNATIHFTKWATELFPDGPTGIFADMAGVIVGGNVGEGTFTGEALTRKVDPVTGVITVEAVYRFFGSKHSFTASILGVQEVAGVG